MRSFLTLLLCPVLLLAAPTPKEKDKPVIDIRDADDKVILAAEDILTYDWSTHTLTLKEGAKKKLVGDRKIGAKFKVTVDGKAAFEGQFLSPILSDIRETPCIVTPEFGDKLGEDKVQIQAAYPTSKYTKTDKRDVKELKEALEKAGKLKAEK